MNEQFRNANRRREGTIHTDVLTYILTHRHTDTFIGLYTHISTYACKSVSWHSIILTQCITSFLMATDWYIRWQGFSKKICNYDAFDSYQCCIVKDLALCQEEAVFQEISCWWPPFSVKFLFVSIIARQSQTMFHSNYISLTNYWNSQHWKFD